jgi:hypothetical protein
MQKLGQIKLGSNPSFFTLWLHDLGRSDHSLNFSILVPMWDYEKMCLPWLLRE